MKNKLNVLYLPSWFPQKNNPMYGIFCKRQAVGLADYCNVTVLYVEYEICKNIKDYLFLKSLPPKLEEENNVKYLIFYSKLLKGVPFLIFFKDIYFAVVGYKLIKRKYGKPDISHVQAVWPAGLMAITLRIIFNLKYIVTERFSGTERLLLSKKYGSIVKFIYSKSSGIYGVIDNVAILLKKYFPPKVLGILPNAVDTERFKSVSLPNEKKDVFKLICIGNLEEIKGIRFLIDAIKIVKKKHEVNLKIIGGGSLEGEFKNIISNNNLNENIELIGRVDPSTIPSYLDKANVLVLPSLSENIGNVLLEAMSMGLPVVATKSGGPQYVVPKHAGVLVVRGSSESLADGIETIIKNYDTYDSMKIRKYILETFSPNVIYGRIIKAYKLALGS